MVELNIAYGRDDINYDTWFDDYSKQLARQHTRDELESMYHEISYYLNRATGSHLRAIQASHSMQSQSMRRAHANNVVMGGSESRNFVHRALVIHELFPEHAKQPEPVVKKPRKRKPKTERVE